MDYPIDVSFKIGQTTIRVLRGDLTEIDADVLVSSDDIYLSMGGGVSYALGEKAGDALKQDTRKQIFPLPVGSVVVTTAGRLKAKYVFHAITLDFASRPSPDVLIARLMQRIIQLGATLNVTHIALPLLGGGTAGQSKKEVLTYMLQSAAYYVCGQNIPISTLTIVIFGSTSVQLPLADFAQKMKQAEELQKRIERLQTICNDMSDDNELNEVLQNRIDHAAERLSKLFHFDALEQNITYGKVEPLTLETYQEARRQLQEAIDKITNEIVNKKQLQGIEERRLRELEKHRALVGLSAAPELQIEIEDIQSRTAQRAREILQAEKKQKLYQSEFSSLRQI